MEFLSLSPVTLDLRVIPYNHMAVELGNPKKSDFFAQCTFVELPTIGCGK